jgi:DNA-binding MarR family transcriptional regulator
MSADDDELVLALRVVEVAREVSRAYGVHLRGRYALSNARLALLLLLDRSRDRAPRPADLATRMGCSRATVTRLLQGLERDGLIAGHRDRDDGRARRIALTAAGTRRLREVEPANARRLRALLWHTSAVERRDLARLLDALQAGLHALRSP